MTGVALLSGGLDSTVATAAQAKDTGVALALTAHYGQRAASAEIAAARRIARALGLRHRVLRLDFLRDVTDGALVRADLPLPKPAGMDALDDPAAAGASMRAVWVPNRNGVLIAAAAAVAESIGAERVVVGFNAEEARTFPDNGEEFLARTNAALALSTLSGVRVVAPTVALDKLGIVRLGLELGAPLELVWSCYEGGQRHCLACESCLRLCRALEGAGALERVRAAWEGSIAPGAREDGPA